ncbi:MAG: hypothetical protein ACUZ8H_03930 [Candidatus Anammoxibacter sp.]
MNKIFLGGTCTSSWREELITLLKVDFFNPVVQDWTQQCKDIEIDEKKNKCNIHLYVMTIEMKGIFSVAEVVDSANTKNKRTFLHIIPKGFDEFQLRSWQSVVDLVNARGGIAYIDTDLRRTATILNLSFKEGAE